MARNGFGFGALVPLLAHACLLVFIMVLILKLNSNSSLSRLSWWWVFCPLFLFHGVTYRCKCSMPAPNTPNDRQWSPSHSVMVVPLMLVFEVLLCCYLQIQNKAEAPMSLEVVFLPLVLLQGLVLADNFRMCMILMPGEDDNMTDEALWETLPHFAVAVSMVFFMAATIFTALKLSGSIDVLGWWDLLVNFCIGEFFAFLLCVKWVNPHLPPRPAAPRLFSQFRSAASASDPAAADNAAGPPAPSLAAGVAAAVEEGSGAGEGRAEGGRVEESPRGGGGAGGGGPILRDASSRGGDIEASGEASRRDLMAAAAAVVAADIAAAAGPAAGAASAAAEGGSGDGGQQEIEGAGSGGPDDEAGDCFFTCGGMSELGGHFLKAAIVVFQVLLCFRLEAATEVDPAQPSWGRDMSMWTLFSPLLAMEAASLLSSLLLLGDALLLACYSSNEMGLAVAACFADYDPCAFLTRGMRLVGWWSMHDEAKEERRSFLSATNGYHTFDPTPPSHVKRMRKGELLEEVTRLQSALVDQTESSKAQRQELDRLQQEKVLCRVCFERDISLVLLPCRHRVLCSTCAGKCKHCPICRRAIQERMAVYDV